MPPRDNVVETLEIGIVAMQNNIANFEFAREGLLKLKAMSVGAEKERVEHALEKNQEAADIMKRKLAGEIGRLTKERSRP